LFGIFFAVMLNYAFGSTTEGVLLSTRSDGNLFNLSRLKAKSKVHSKCLRDFLFADDAALVSNTESGLQLLVEKFNNACNEFGLTISLKKTQIMGINLNRPPVISIGDHTLEVVDEFTYLGSSLCTSLSLDNELNKRIGKAATAMSKLKKRVWENNKLTLHTKVQIYRACILSTLLYGSEAWTTHARQEKKLNTFHLRCLRRILHIKWQDKVSNNRVLQECQLPSIFTILKQRRMRWLGHVVRMDDGRLPKDILYGELAVGKRSVGRPNLRYKDVCKRDLKDLKIDIATWEEQAKERGTWKTTLGNNLLEFENSIKEQHENRRLRRKNPNINVNQNDNEYICIKCRRICLSSIGLISHARRCNKSYTNP
jgi:hypothetical protein